MTSFAEKVNQALVDRGLTMQGLAEQAGMPEPELRALCQQGDPRASDMTRLGQALGLDPIYFMPSFRQGAFNVAGIGNTQKIKIGKAAAHELAQHLSSCQRMLDLAMELVAAKNETIMALRAGYNQPN